MSHGNEQRGLMDDTGHSFTVVEVPYTDTASINSLNDRCCRECPHRLRRVTGIERCDIISREVTPLRGREVYQIKASCDHFPPLDEVVGQIRMVDDRCYVYTGKDTGWIRT